MLNTPENREAFVTRFGPAKHPNGSYCVDDKTAYIILRNLDRDPKYYNVPENLWNRIMQDRATFMLGQQYIPENVTMTDKAYTELGKRVTSEIYNFVCKLN